MEAHTYISKLKQEFEPLQDPQKAGPMEKYMKNRFSFLGIKSPERKAALKKFLSQNGLPPAELFEEVCLGLMELDEREYHYCSIEICEKCHRYWKPQHIELFEEMALKNSWWDTVDILSTHLVGRIFQKHPELIPVWTDKWMASDNFWLQRICLIYQLLYKEKTNWELLQSFIEPLKGSNEFFIQKAIGWALRQYSKTEPELVKTYIADNDLKPLSEREGLKWLHKNS